MSSRLRETARARRTLHRTSPESPAPQLQGRENGTVRHRDTGGPDPACFPIVAVGRARGYPQFEPIWRLDPIHGLALATSATRSAAPHASAGDKGQQRQHDNRGDRWPDPPGERLAELLGLGLEHLDVVLEAVQVGLV